MRPGSKNSYASIITFNYIHMSRFVFRQVYAVLRWFDVRHANGVLVPSGPYTPDRSDHQRHHVGGVQTRYSPQMECDTELDSFRLLNAWINRKRTPNQLPPANTARTIHTRNSS